MCVSNQKQKQATVPHILISNWKCRHFAGSLFNYISIHFSSFPSISIRSLARASPPLHREQVIYIIIWVDPFRINLVLPRWYDTMLAVQRDIQPGWKGQGLYVTIIQQKKKCKRMKLQLYMPQGGKKGKKRKIAGRHLRSRFNPLQNFQPRLPFPPFHICYQVY